MARMKSGLAAVLVLGIAACAPPATKVADLILVGGRVYTLSWPDPDGEGAPAHDAPHDASGWRPDAEAVAMADGRIMLVGSRDDVLARQGGQTRVIDLHGATVVPGLIDSHVHLANLGAALGRVDLVGVATEADAVARVAARAATVPKSDWIVGWGWDEGAWTSHLPDMRLLSERVPTILSSCTDCTPSPSGVIAWHSSGRASRGRRRRRPVRDQEGRVEPTGCC
jgi:predicted amidohydrolase YtcJ